MAEPLKVGDVVQVEGYEGVGRIVGFNPWEYGALVVSVRWNPEHTSVHRPTMLRHATLDVPQPVGGWAPVAADESFSDYRKRMAAKVLARGMDLHPAKPKRAAADAETVRNFAVAAADRDAWENVHRHLRRSNGLALVGVMS